MKGLERLKLLPQNSPYFNDLDLSGLQTDENSEICLIAIESEAQETANSICAIGPTILLAKGLAPEKVSKIIHETNATSLIQSSPFYFKKDLICALRFITHPGEYFKLQGKSLSPSAVLKLELRITRASTKSQVFEQIHSYCEVLKSQSLTDSIIAICEELFMNAMIDGPRESRERGMESQTSLESGKSIYLRFFESQERLIISCEDPFGSLDTAKISKRMNYVYSVGAGKAINLHSTSGAGLGCVIIFEHSEALVFGVKPGEMTLVTCVLPKGLSNRQRESLDKSLHFISFKQG